MKEIPIFFTIDDSYAPYLGVALQSLTEHASAEYQYRIIVIQENVSEKNKERLSAFGNGRFRIEFMEMKEGLSAITDREENRLRCDYFTMTIYYRLFIPEMFPQYDKGIYLDSDIVVPGDISELYRMELGDNLIGACPDHSVADIPELAKYMEGAIGVSRYRYINSGVLLMNLKQMREKRFGEKFLHLLNTYHFDCIAPDQDYLNAMCCGKILYLDECWDAMPNERKAPLKAPKLIHYNLFDKPWCYEGIQYEEYFWESAKKTPWYEELLAHRQTYSDAQKASDASCMRELIRKADQIPDTETTFRKIYESGGEIRV